jgi:hypothetical protein
MWITDTRQIITVWCAIPNELVQHFGICMIFEFEPLAMICGYHTWLLH